MVRSSGAQLTVSTTAFYAWTQWGSTIASHSCRAVILFAQTPAGGIFFVRARGTNLFALHVEPPSHRWRNFKKDWKSKFRAFWSPEGTCETKKSS